MIPRSPSHARLFFVCALLLLADPNREAMAAWPHAAGDAVPVATGNPSQVQPVSISDGAGGAIIAWRDDRNGTMDVFAQRIDAYGNAKWLANGVLVCGAAGQQDQITMAPDGAGGAWIAWRDIRTGAWDIYGA